ncbi:PAS domain-containing protein, partial [bacterium]|nr:PAS domain-containing protein [bacterium]
MPRNTKDTRAGRELAREILLKVVESTAGLTGEAFFEGLTRQLAQVLDVHCAFLTERIPGVPPRLRTLSFWSGDDWRPNFEFALAGTPCEQTMRQGQYFCATEVRAAFPENEHLPKLGADSYFGLSFSDSDGRVLGNLSIMDKAPLDSADESWLSSILEIFASRAASELERVRAIQALTESEERFRSLAENLPGIVFSYLQNAEGHRQLRYLGPNALSAVGPDAVARIRESADAIFDLVHPADLDRLRESAQASLRDGQPLQGEFRATLRGEERWMEVFARSA